MQSQRTRTIAGVVLFVAAAYFVIAAFSSGRFDYFPSEPDQGNSSTAQAGPGPEVEIQREEFGVAADEVGAEVLSDAYWQSRPDLCQLALAAYIRLQFSEGGEQEQLDWQFQATEWVTGKKRLKKLQEFPDRMSGLGLIPPQVPESLWQDTLSSGRAVIANYLNKQVYEYAAFSDGGNDLPSGRMDHKPLNFPPEMHAYRVTGLSPTEIPQSVRQAMSQVRDRLLQKEGLLEHEEALMLVSQRLALKESGVAVPLNEREEFWRTVLPAYEKLRSQRDDNQQEYVQELSQILRESGLIEG